MIQHNLITQTQPQKTKKTQNPNDKSRSRQKIENTKHGINLEPSTQVTRAITKFPYPPRYHVSASGSAEGTGIGGPLISSVVILLLHITYKSHDEQSAQAHMITSTFSCNIIDSNTWFSTVWFFIKEDKKSHFPFIKDQQRPTWFFVVFMLNLSVTFFLLSSYLLPHTTAVTLHSWCSSNDNHGTSYIVEKSRSESSYQNSITDSINRGNFFFLFVFVINALIHKLRRIIMLGINSK